jgi:hypothetical protein
MGSTFLVMLDVSMKQIGLRLIPVVKTHSKKLSGKGQNNPWLLPNSGMAGRSSVVET